MDVTPEQNLNNFPTIYVAYMFNPKPKQPHGILTQQVIQFTYFEDPKHPTFIELKNVSMDKICKTIMEIIPDYEYCKLLDRRSGYDYAHIMLYAIPFVLADIEDDTYQLVLSHRLASVLLHELICMLDCESFQKFPNDYIECTDKPTSWTLYVKNYPDHHELELKQNKLNINIPNIHGIHIKNMRFTDILRLIQYTELISGDVYRYNDVPLDVESKRTFERFRIAKTERTPQQVLIDIKDVIYAMSITIFDVLQMVLELFDQLLRFLIYSTITFLNVFK